MSFGGTRSLAAKAWLASLASPASWSWPNILTISRFFMAPVVYWLVLRAEPDLGASWGLVVMAGLVTLSDALDGRLARRYQTESSLGAFLDPIADKVVVLGCAACFVAVGRYWWLPVALIWARDLGVSALRVRYARRGISLPARPLAKWKVGIQGGTLTVAALLPLNHLDWLHSTLIWAAAAITLVTGAQYVWDGRSGGVVVGAGARSGAVSGPGSESQSAPEPKSIKQARQQVEGD